MKKILLLGVLVSLQIIPVAIFSAYVGTSLFGNSIWSYVLGCSLSAIVCFFLAWNTAKLIYR